MSFKNGDKLHEPGECHTGNAWCYGIGVWAPDPFAQEIRGDETPFFQCAGENYESAQDI